MKRAQQVQTHVIEWTPAMLATLPRVVIGNFSASAKSERWILPHAAVYPYGVPQTVSELTRDWMAVSYRLPMRARVENRAEMEHRIAQAQMPLAALAHWTGEAAYTDIAQAYRQIAAAVGWNPEYWPSRGVLNCQRLRPVSGFLWGHKLWRSMLYSLARKTPMQIMRHGVITHENVPSPYYNPRFVGLVLDVLNGVGWDLRRAGAVYIHTDGAIVPTRHLAAAEEVYQSWGLEWAIKGEGETEIYGVGSYRVGLKRTVQRIPRSFMHLIAPSNIDALRKDFRLYSNDARLYARHLEW
jgi:hypothetical protein